MGLDIYFSEDILNALQAIDETNLDATSLHDAPEVKVYRQGFAAAIGAVAAAFGIQYTPLRTTTIRSGVCLPIQEWEET